MAVAVLIDAVFIRSAVVPALMFLCGRANWWLPGWLDRVLPHVSLEGSERVDAAPDGTASVGVAR